MEGEPEPLREGAQRCDRRTGKTQHARKSRHESFGGGSLASTWKFSRQELPAPLCRHSNRLSPRLSTALRMLFNSYPRSVNSNIINAVAFFSCGIHFGRTEFPRASGPSGASQRSRRTELWERSLPRGE